jgi:hypothetical protein
VFLYSRPFLPIVPRRTCLLKAMYLGMLLLHEDPQLDVKIECREVEAVHKYSLDHERHRFLPFVAGVGPAVGRFAVA